MNYHGAKAFVLDKLEKELARDLTYHGLHHTLDVLHRTEELCYLEKVGVHDEMLLKTAALFHDSGFTISNRNHEELGCHLVRTHLPHYDYTQEEIERICGMIMATKIPQSPSDKLEEIICDADLDYLGRDDFYTIGATLFEELKAYDVLKSEEDWNRLQVRFLEKHHFFTPANRLQRAPRKRRYLQQLQQLVARYEKK